MTAQPEDLAGAFRETDPHDFEALVVVRRVFREAYWCLTRDEERDLVDCCRDLRELCFTTYVYDLAPVA